MGWYVRYRLQAGVKIKQLGISLLATLLVACAGPSGTVPIDERGRGGQRAESVTSGYHTVRRGETLYQIAFRYGWDWKALASNNRMAAPYTIYPGQRINLNTRTASRGPVISRPSSNSPRAATQNSSASRPQVATAPAPAARPGITTTTRPAATPARPAAPQPSVPASVAGWNWPARGTLLARFQSNGSLNKGIDIAGQLGEPVKAAADGAVVYAGRGLIGYGEMIIIKHDETYLSAYAHNSRLLVSEGDQVKVGQTIAEMGSSGTDRVKLHFEIRRKGQPVDPLAYLPKS
ncbi:peptidoglycan DD-metalloendopeptidase family protein [Pseudomonas neustonica]|uniref:LysM peptidoglycan-binding domain-containing protein n=1 Tax=Pseudomonas neustonica TaxID=2487346 RepID=A0ABX9XN42_9PSED|nr:MULTISPECIES: peptidoglycan DD-metalloendopeptidase family protein [Pseudomonas]MBA6419218.1 peptidoglycan DD-metalloendopeptidase family protein [Pseudomonas sp. 5Ae-yellow]ROZ87005.1 LysM peptidoglycan-binding domain-containing protein [Pseudomonas sp. SSM44]ROZ88379.1 LysM peptidoglycan-binding domain-containing protein [Pseudomonas neustonica]